MANGHGGKRAGSGRKRGRPDLPKYVPDPDNMQPLDYMLETLRNSAYDHLVRMDAAKSAAPYCHARLQNIVADVDVVIEALNWDN